MQVREYTEEQRTGFRQTYAARGRRLTWAASIVLAFVVLRGLAPDLASHLPSWSVVIILGAIYGYRVMASRCPACARFDMLHHGRCRHCGIVLDESIAATADDDGPRPDGTTSALAREYLRDDTPRQNMAVLLLIAALCLAAPWAESTIRGVDPLTPVQGALAVIVVMGAAAGALYHPVRRFWPSGLVAGGVAGGCGLTLTHAYLVKGGPMSDPMPFFVAMLGVVPGGFLYWLLMQDQVVSRTERQALGHEESPASASAR
jgi:hypothetical protein